MGRFTGVRMDSVRAYRPRSVEAGPGVHLRDRPRPSEDARLVVTTLAGEPFVEKPPGIYVVAGAFVELLNGLLPAHDAARLATGSFVALALVFLALTAREIFGRGFASAAVLIPLGCLGTLPRMHQLIPDVVLLAGVAVAMYGRRWPEVALGGRRSAWSRRRFRILRQRIVRSRRARLDRSAAAALRCMAHPALRRGARRRGRRRRGPSGFLDARAFRAVAGTGSRGSRS